MDAPPVLGPQRGQAHLQIGLVLFQAAQQALRFRDSFFECDHEFDKDAASRVSTVTQPEQGASYKLDAGWVGSYRKRELARPSDRLARRLVAV
jgi:hypothetical protein